MIDFSFAPREKGAGGRRREWSISQLHQKTIAQLLLVIDLSFALTEKGAGGRRRDWLISQLCQKTSAQLLLAI